MSRYRRILVGFITLCFLPLAFGTSVNAALLDRGNGLIYDDDRDITWLQNANLAGQTFTWQEAVDWADALVFGGLDDWRLPTTLQPDSSCSEQNLNGFGVSGGIGCTGSEMGHLRNSEGINPAAPGLFINIQTTQPYWSETEFNANGAWRFGFPQGLQNLEAKNIKHAAWAVRDGDVAPVPAPSAVLLMGTGLFGFVSWRWWARG